MSEGLLNLLNIRLSNFLTNLLKSEQSYDMTLFYLGQNHFKIFFCQTRDF